jgi:hypothetical protein
MHRQPASTAVAENKVGGAASRRLRAIAPSGVARQDQAIPRFRLASPKATNNFLPRVRICSSFVLRSVEAVSPVVPVPSKSFRPALYVFRSIAIAAARAKKARRKASRQSLQPLHFRTDRAAPDDRKAERPSRPRMAPQRLEKIGSAPGNGRAPEAFDPQDLVQDVRALTLENSLPPRRKVEPKSETPSPQVAGNSQAPAKAAVNCTTLILRRRRSAGCHNPCSKWPILESSFETRLRRPSGRGGLVGAAAQKCSGKPGSLGVAVAVKWRRKGLKTWTRRPEMAWPRRPRTDKMWYPPTEPPTIFGRAASP